MYFCEPMISKAPIYGARQSWIVKHLIQCKIPMLLCYNSVEYKESALIVFLIPYIIFKKQL